ncbi:hypothetical protein Poly30_29280 [Planctomycetes bacterium Poly30]|uniref:LTD domain-containing protein n=1 Tax=Saltatorellus ferox TaxID=2528018 RepID=A0A518ETI4_9BACT|nr:hypothetical protein Poly30_29280 [Planctomycetes bacterium Poly30]
MLARRSVGTLFMAASRWVLSGTIAGTVAGLATAASLPSPAGAEGTASPILRAHLVAERQTHLELELGTLLGTSNPDSRGTWEVLLLETTHVAAAAVSGEVKTAAELFEALRGARVLRRMAARSGEVLRTPIPSEAFGSGGRLGVLVRARGAATAFHRGMGPELGWSSVALPLRDPAEPLAASPPRGAILVTEFMKDPAAVSDTRGEWVEFQNRTAAAIDLEGWTLRDEGSNRTVITASSSGAGVVVPAGGFVVLGRQADPALNGGVMIAATYSGFTLGNGADQIILEAPGGHEIDRVEYEDGTSNWPDAAGASVALGPRFVGTSVAVDGAAWCSGVDVMPAGDLGSPGELNQECQ